MTIKSGQVETEMAMQNGKKECQKINLL